MGAHLIENIRVTPWRLTEDFREYGLDGYRIWTKETAFGFFQRHEWQRQDGGFDLEDWIKSTPGHAEHGLPVTAEDISLAETRSLSRDHQKELNEFALAQISGDA
jgi:hypothetical protein